MTRLVRIADARVRFDTFRLRTPFTYGKGAQHEMPRTHAEVCVEERGGARAWGAAEMNVAAGWSWPSREVQPEVRLRVMQETMRRFAAALVAAGAWGHPIDLYWESHEALQAVAREAADAAGLAAAPPALAQMMCGSPFDLAAHDAFGRLLGRNSLDSLGRDLVAHDLSWYLGPGFEGMYPTDVLAAAPVDAPE